MIFTALRLKRIKDLIKWYRDMIFFTSHAIAVISRCVIFINTGVHIVIQTLTTNLMIEALLYKFVLRLLCQVVYLQGRVVCYQT